LLEEPPAYQTVLKEKLKAGLSYPTASAAALISYFDDPALNETISQPNNILGIYYMKALMKRKSTIKPYTLLRCGSHYHEEMLGSKSDVGEAEILSSARSIRHSIASDLPLSEIADHIPAQVLQLLVQHQGQSFPITTDDFTAVLGYRLLNEMNKGFTDYIDVSENLSDRIVKEVGHYRSLSDFIDLLKTKDFTHARISRCLMHIMLGMQNETLADYIRSDYIAYARPLGFRNDSVTLLSAAKEHTSIPLLGKLADAKNILSPKAYAMLQEDIYASHVYQLAVAQKFHTTFSHEYQRRIIKI
ncbi:MAG: nucleotidyltransferase family protein, partial [Clostridia bacterium]|nr:nucleotidyltransferase family protein [Clostridia bacterium]